jgi:mannose-1-phosphate guanylyltransferase
MTADLSVEQVNNKKLPVTVLLLAAGLGNRLQPYTNNWPKCLMPIHGVPLLQYWLEATKKIGAMKVLINLHYFAPLVETFLKSSKFADSVDTVFEQELKGTAGTIRANRGYFSGSTILVAHADNYCQCSFDSFLHYHQTERPSNCLITMMTFDTATPSSCGIVQIDELGVVSAFYEKVANPPGHRANGAVYLLEPEVLDWLNNHPEVNDFSTEVLPKFIGRIATWHNNHVHIDIGTPHSLLAAQQSLSIRMSNKSAIEMNDWEKWFARHPIHEQLKHLFNTKTE